MIVILLLALCKTKTNNEFVNSECYMISIRYLDNNKEINFNKLEIKSFKLR